MLFLDASLVDRAATARCREVTAGETVVVAASAPVRLQRPDGTVQQLVPENGRVIVSGLDRQGLYRLESKGLSADLAVTAAGQAHKQDDERSVAMGANVHARAVDRRPWLIAAACIALLLGLLSQTRRARLLSGLVSGLLFTPLYLDVGDNPCVIRARSRHIVIDAAKRNKVTVGDLRVRERLRAVVAGGGVNLQRSGRRAFRGATVAGHCSVPPLRSQVRMVPSSWYAMAVLGMAQPMLMCLFLQSGELEVRRRRDQAASVIDTGRILYPCGSVERPGLCWALALLNRESGHIGGSNACDQVGGCG